MACSCLFGPPDLGVRGKYELIRKLGKGGQAVVWLASEKDTNELFALKFISTRSATLYCAPQTARRAGICIKSIV